MFFLLVLVPYALAYVAVAIWRLYNGKSSVGGHGGDDMLHSSRLQVLKLVNFAHMALLAVAAISAGASQEILSTLAAVALLLVDLGVALSLRATNPRKWFWAQAGVAAIAIVAWPTILLAQSQTGERFAGVLTSHVIAALLLEMLSCPPVLSLLLTVSSLALPLVVLLTNSIALPNPVMEVGSLLFLPLVIMLLGVCHYVQNVHRLLQAACTCVKELDTENTTAQSYVTALQVQTGFVTFLASQLSGPLNSMSDCLEIIKEGVVNREEVDIYDTLMVLNYQANSYLANVVSFGRLSNIFPFDIKQLVEEAVESFKEAAAVKGMRIVQCTSDLVSKIVVGSEGLINEVLLRLLNSAIRLSSADTVTVVASSAIVHLTLNPCCTELSLRVQDNGQGLSEERIRALSERVNGLEASEIDKEDENVDLLVCSQIVSDMAGTFGITTPEPGQGTAYDVKLSLPHWDEAELLSKLEGMMSISWNGSETKRSLVTLPESNSKFIEAWQGSISSQFSRVSSTVVTKQNYPGLFPKMRFVVQSNSREVPIFQIKRNASSSLPGLSRRSFRVLRDDDASFKVQPSAASLDVMSLHRRLHGDVPNPDTKSHSFPVDWAKRARQTDGRGEGIPPATSDAQPKGWEHQQSNLSVTTVSWMSGNVVCPSDTALDTDVEALRLRNLQALYIDENAENRLPMKAVLQSLGLCQVHVADGFESAMQTFTQFPEIHVVLTNHPDPQASLEFAQAIRQRVTSRLYILALTTRLDHHLLETVRSFPAETINRFALKPLSRAYFMYLLMRFFVQAPGAHAAILSSPQIMLQ